jgi:hypothetical protein
MRGRAGQRTGSPSDQPHPLQTRMPVLADDDVVVHGNAERGGDIDDRPGHLDIGLRRRRVAGGMIVHEHIIVAMRLIKRCFSKSGDPVGTRSGGGNE